ITSLFLLLGLTVSAQGQSLDVSLKDVDLSQLPRVLFKVCVSENQSIVRGLDVSRMTLMENGVPQELSIRCPDPMEINSVVLVLDNSGSMLGALSKLIEASQRMVDNLGDNDECAIITFGRGINIVQDFTTDKAQLKTVLGNMVANGGTPLFSAAYQGCQLLQMRPGNRHAVIITDGEDNQSTHTSEEVVALANNIDANLHTIAFDIDQQYQAVMRDMAVRTGGVYFFVSRPSELTEVYEKIADIITEECCIAEYTSDNCVDALRSLLMQVTHEGRTGTVVQDFVSPIRAGESLLTVTVPESITPLATDRGVIELSPAPSTELSLTLSFILEYDQNLVEIPVLPFTLGTMAQNQVVEMTRVGPGEMRFVFSGIRPPFQTTRLIAFPIQALVADSSRYVHFRIRDAQIEGCPTTFSFASDSTLICQCFRAFDLAMDSVLMLRAEEVVEIPVEVLSGLETGTRLQADATFSLPAELGEIDVVPGSLLPEGALQWEREGNMLRLFTPLPVFPKDTSGLLALLRVGPNMNAGVRRFALDLVASELWQRCCPEDGEEARILVLQDGLCEFILREKDAAVQVTNAPNPFTSEGGAHTWISLEIPEERRGHFFTLDVLDGNGRIVRRLYDGPLEQDVLRLPFDASNLPTGVYHAVLRGDKDVISRAMLYVR
ncbi:MAG: VWA domain-containing protein, partial [Bacteroidetes bacterium]|nr:VWA domain-containing protein [Bacteroidota bacterium]